MDFLTLLSTAPFDLAIAVLLLVSVLVGFGRGFVREITTLLGWAVITLPMLFFFVYGGDYLSVSGFRRYIETGGIIALFLAVLLIMRLSLRDFYRNLRIRRASFLDRFGGILFGFFRGGLVILMAFAIFERAVSEDAKEQIAEGSMLRDPIAAINASLGMKPAVEFPDQSRPANTPPP